LWGASGVSTQILATNKVTRICENRLIARDLQTSGRRDSNPRPPEPHSGALPDCATSRTYCTTTTYTIISVNIQVSVFLRFLTLGDECHTYYHTYESTSHSRTRSHRESIMGIYLQRRSDGRLYGTLVIDRIIDGSRLKISSGSKDMKTVRRMDSLIDELIDRAQESHLRNLVEKRVTIRQLFELDQKGTLYNPLHDPEVVQPLRSNLETWMSSYSGWNDKTRQGNRELIETMFKKLESKITNPMIEDVPKLLRSYRERCESEDHPRAYNLVRSVFHRFIRLRFGKSSPLFTQISDVEKLPDRPKNPQTAKTPGQIEKLCRSLPEKYRGMVWTMCTTGVGWDEYGKLTPRDDLKHPRIYVEGTKMDRKDKRRRREVPFIYSPHPQVGSERQFRKVLTNVSKKLRMENVRVYTFRKCYANWLVESGVPQWRVEMYMGHLPQSQTQKYQTTDVWRWLSEDGQLLRKWIEEKRQASGKTTKTFVPGTLPLGTVSSSPPKTKPSPSSVK
jgi:integrase